PLVSGNLVKSRATRSQMKLSAADRQNNLIDAFAIKNPAEFAGKKVFLIDDVYTTGATMEECATQLVNSGAKSVWGIAIAREG
ncbi:MAG: ComF family protein, partial [Rhabdochlamydiaceae bacterium]